MQDINFCIPTRFIMGRGCYVGVGEEIKKCGGKNVLIVHSGGKYNTDVLASVRSSISSAGLTYYELGERVSQPRMSLVLRGVNLCKRIGIDFVLALGGGTVMDTAKAIAFFSENDGDLTEYVLSRSFSPKCLLVASIVTLSGTGSEISATAMIIDDRGGEEIKYPLFQDSIRFAFSMMDPTLTMTLPQIQTMSGAFDAITHIMEYFFCGSDAYELQGRMCEAVIHSIMSAMRSVKQQPDNYEIRAQLQMGATFANSTLLGLGCASDWAMHYMENPITTATHSPHGSTLAIIAPAWMKYCFRRDLRKAVNFAVRVMDVPARENDEATALAGIDALESFLREVGLPVRLSEIGVSRDRFELFAQRALDTSGKDYVGKISKLSREEILKIYSIAE